jgi:hypothetical protein
MDAHSPLHYQATVMHRLANLHEGSKFGVFAAVMGLLCGYATWRLVVEGFAPPAIIVSSLAGASFGGTSLGAYLMA